MKKLLLAAVLVLAVCAWAQPDWESVAGQSPDTVYTKITVAMCPFRFSYNDGTTGGAHTAPVWNAVVVTADSLEYTLDGCISPCQIAHLQNWLENTGGITADFNIQVNDAITPDWTHHDAATSCATLVPATENVAGGMFAFTASTTTAETPVWTVLPEALGADELENVLAEDPALTGDDTWRDGEADQRNVHIALVAPVSATNTNNQTMRVLLIGKVSD